MNALNFFAMLWHHDNVIVESVAYKISWTLSPRAFFAKNANSVVSIIADNSFLETVYFNILDVAATSLHIHSPPFNFLPAYKAARPAASAASAIMTNLILDSDSSSVGTPHILADNNL